MRDGRPNPDIWGNIITCGEIAVGIYEIVATKKRGLEVICTPFTGHPVEGVLLCGTHMSTKGNV